MVDPEIVDVTDQRWRMDDARLLFREYADEIGIDLRFQGFEQELAGLPGRYTSPEGCILLAEHDGNVLGCVAARPINEVTAEIKRLYVRPKYRRHKVAHGLVNAVLGFVVDSEYERVLLDTLANMTGARRLYEKFGFRETKPYYDNPLPDVVYYELDFLADARRRVKSRADELGEGCWAVTFYNDDITQMQEVVDIIKRHFDHDEELATALMSLTHFHGSAIVKRYRLKTEAEAAVRKIREDCRIHGLQLYVDVYEIT